MEKELRSGYTTGTHATAVFGALLKNYFDDKVLESIGVELPKGDIVEIEVKFLSENHFSTIKVDNDDLDVTKGCCIEGELYEEKPQNLKEQTPSFFKVQNTSFFIYAGKGVGIVTKEGLKISPNFPAINPVPLKMMEVMASGIKDTDTRDLHIVISVVNGEEIAKQTANAKVGVIGGISILGTRGIVKPISSDAYMDSLESELSVAEANGMKTLVCTIGNTSQDYALKHFEAVQVVEIGNFVYDVLTKLKNKQFERVLFVVGSGKMAKVAQGCKNTHNRFGGIDFTYLKTLLFSELGIDFADKEFVTFKSLLSDLEADEVEAFLSVLGEEALNNIGLWLRELGTEIKNTEIRILQGKDVIQKEVKW